jgi:phage shock protein PspC (stress-responsive transcriptional regulator)
MRKPLWTGHDCYMATTTFGDQLADLWRTRPVRLPDRGPIAGVAAGIGYRYGVDPVLVRIAFVISTIFGGAGLVLYIAGWLLLNDARQEYSRAESLLTGRRGRHSGSGRTVLLIIALCIAIGTMGPVGISLGGSGLISTALMLTGLWLLYQRRPLPPPLPTGMPASRSRHLGHPGFGRSCGPGQYGSPWQGAQTEYGPYTYLPHHYEPNRTAQPAAETGPAETPAVPKDESAEQAPAHESAAPNAEPTTDPQRSEPNEPVPSSVSGSALLGDMTTAAPPSWDPLGVAPFAWDLPEPRPARQPEEVAAQRTRSRFTSVVIGLAILAAAGCGAAAALGAEWFTPARVGAIALAVVGIGLLIGAFLRRGYGLLIVTAPLLGFVVLASIVGPIEFDSTGNQTWQPATTADLQPVYVVRFGESTLDLRSLNLTEDRAVRVEQEFGQATVLIPENMNVRSHCEMEFGDAKCLPEGLTGGPDGTDGPVLTLDVDGRFGKVEVLRG